MGISLRSIQHLKAGDIIRQSNAILPVNANDSSMIYPAVTQDRNSRCCVIKCFKNVIRGIATLRQDCCSSRLSGHHGWEAEQVRRATRSRPT